MKTAVEILGQVVIPGWWYWQPVFHYLLLFVRMYFIKHRSYKSILSKLVEYAL